jgi:hypothetical protein
MRRLNKKRMKTLTMRARVPPITEGQTCGKIQIMMDPEAIQSVAFTPIIINKPEVRFKAIYNNLLYY